MTNISKYLVPLLFAPSVSVSEPILVLSGEHDDYTRLVLYTESQNTIDTILNGREFNMTVSGQQDGFSTDQVFARIPRTRISSIASTSDTLAVGLNCDCTVEVFPVGPALIAVDVADPENVTNSVDPTEVSSVHVDWSNVDAFDTQFLAPVNSNHQTHWWSNSGSLSDLLELKSNQQIQGPQAQKQVRSLSLPIILNNEGTTLAFELADDFLLQSPSSEIEYDLQQLAGQIQTQIASAADAGLVVENIDWELEQENPLSTTLQDRVQQTENQTADEEFLNIGSTSLQDHVSRRDSPNAHATCPPIELFGVESWASGGGFVSDLAQLRRSLYDERDRQNDAENIDLARFYAYYGFGREALQLLSDEYTAGSTEWAIQTVAQIIDLPGALTGSKLEKVAHCSDSTSMWYHLASPESVISDAGKATKILNALGALPEELRIMFSARMARSLRLSGFSDAALQAMRLATRTRANNGSELQIELANLETESGNKDASRRILTDVVSSNSTESANALVKYVALQVETNSAISKDTLLLLESFATEYRGASMETEIEKAIVLALAKTGQFEKAFNRLSQLSDSGAAVSDTEATLVSILTFDGTNIDFLRYAISDNRVDFGRYDADLQNAARVRLEDLGFKHHSSFSEDRKASEESVLHSADATRSNERLDDNGSQYSNAVAEVSTSVSEEGEVEVAGAAVQAVGQDSPVGADEQAQPGLISASTSLVDEVAEIRSSLVRDLGLNSTQEE